MDIHEVFEDRKGVIRGRTPKNDRQKEKEDTKGVLKGAHRRTHEKSLKIQKE